MMVCTTPAVRDRPARILDPAESWRFAQLAMSHDWLNVAVENSNAAFDAPTDEVSFRYSSSLLGARLADNLAGVHRDDFATLFVALLSRQNAVNPLSSSAATMVADAAVAFLDGWLEELSVVDVDVIVEHDFAMMSPAQSEMFSSIVSVFGVGVCDFTAVLHLPSMLLGRAWYCQRYDLGTFRASAPVAESQLARIAQMRVLDPNMFVTFEEFADVGVLL